MTNFFLCSHLCLLCIPWSVIDETTERTEDTEKNMEDQAL